MDDYSANTGKMRLEKLEEYFSGVEIAQFGNLFYAAADVTLIIDSNDHVRDAGFRVEELFAAGGRGWVGQKIYETISSECANKIKEMLDDARKGKTSKPREINHIMPHDDDAPVSYIATKLNDNGDVIMFGQHIAEVASLQRRLMSSQLAMEREFSRLRGAESRYRAVFQLSDIPKIIVDATSLRITDINPAAQRVLGNSSQRLENTRILNLFNNDESDILHKLMLAAIEGRRDEEMKISLESGEEISIAATLYREDKTSYLLLQLQPVMSEVSLFPNTSGRKVMALAEQMPDAFVITNATRQIISGNKAFVEVFNIANIKDVVGQPLDIFFDRPNVDCSVLIANVREHTTVRRFATVMRTRHGQKENVEIAATQLKYDDDTILGFWIRPISNMVMGTDTPQENITRSNEQIANLVGHMPLKDIVRETTEMIEKLCIETALELTQNNRASAAQMLGVSRQSLYAKLGKSETDNKSL